MGLVTAVWWLLASVVAAQTVQPSNNASDLPDPSNSPRFYLNATGSVQFPGLALVPLGPYAMISRNAFLDVHISRILVDIDASNANQVSSTEFNYVSCDPEEYEGGNIDVNTVLRIITNQQPATQGQTSSLIFYSTRSTHCTASGLNNLPIINGIFTTVDPVAAGQVANRNFTASSSAVALLSPDPSSYRYAYNGTNGGLPSQPPTTAIAMIILYSITGIITGLFIIIIITGAVRAHRHPERYGPRNAPGQSRQSRAKGIARAMLETLPIVKFGDHHDAPESKQTSSDVEMANQNTAVTTDASKAGDKSVAITTTSAIGTTTEAAKPNANTSPDTVQNPDGTDDAGALGCSICTEDFKRGEEVRVLPCNHKFHPECVDPWLLNVSGTCPLCRINLTQQDDQEAADGMAPPLNPASPFGDRRSQAIHNLLAIAYGSSREERVTALRQYRAERRNRHTAQLNEEERVSRARRFREALRIRTRRHEPNETELEMRNSGIDAISGPQMRL